LATADRQYVEAQESKPAQSSTESFTNIQNPAGGVET